MHGWHQVAQKSTRTTFPSSIFELRREPLMDSKSKAGTGFNASAKTARGSPVPAAAAKNKGHSKATSRKAWNRAIVESALCCCTTLKAEPSSRRLLCHKLEY